MKPTRLVCLLLLIVRGVLAMDRGAELARGFAAPPASARPWVNWFWLNGNITSNGITADLEAMQRVGVGGVMLMDVEQGTPAGPARFGTERWRGLFQHLCTEARRLGLQVDMNNDDGWCGSGGPWITPELSMQTVVWSETLVYGPRKLDEVMARPRTALDHYHDLAVFAFPTPPGEELNMADFSPKFTGSAGILATSPETLITLPRPESGHPVFAQIEFDRPFPARMLQFDLALANGQTCQGELQASDDGLTFKTVRSLEVVHRKEWYGFPEIIARYYRISFASAEPSLSKLAIGHLNLSQKLRIEDIEAKALYVRRELTADSARGAGVDSSLAIRMAQVTNLNQRLGPDGRIRWEVPAGSWTVLRLGYASDGVTNHPAQPEGTGLECDKLSRTATDVMFQGLMKKLVADVKAISPSPLVSTHIDSWEVGSQNWTPKFRNEFKRRRGYDPLPWLPVMTGRVLENLEVSERFLWNLRQTVSELLAENYAGHFGELAHQQGLRLSIEAYGENPSDDLTYAGRADEPMCEFWSWYPYQMAASCTEMTSAAHVYGKPIISAEAFTAEGTEKWQGHPYSVKVYGDWAFCEGVNRFVIHRYAHQPWTNPDRVPGMCMGPFGLHYERTQTWWEQSWAWHQYLARCQYLLQQGRFVADICYLAPEKSPQTWQPPTRSKQRPGYNFDGCPAEVVLSRMSARSGRLVLPDGMNYRLLALSESRVMTPRLLGKIKQLVGAGATVVGPPPDHSPSLAEYPRCDEEIRRLVVELWGNCDGKNLTEHRFGKGRVVWGQTPEEVLAADGVPPDFESTVLTDTAPAVSEGAPLAHKSMTGLRYIHRSMVGGGAEIYFLANQYLEPMEALCSFRVKGASPELWRPDTGSLEPIVSYMNANGTIRIPLRFDPAGSVFVVFRTPAAVRADSITSLTRDGKTILSTALPATKVAAADPAKDATNTFTMAGWVRPDAEIDLPAERDTGVAAFNIIRNDALYPPPGDEVYSGAGQAGTGFSVGRNGICVLEHSANYFSSPLVFAAPLTNWTHVAVVYRDGVPNLFLNGKFSRSGMRSFYTVHPGVGVQHRRGVAPFRGMMGELQTLDHALNEPEIEKLMEATPIPREVSKDPTVEIIGEPGGGFLARVWRTGSYSANIASSQTWTFKAPEVPSPQEITGSWDLRFPPDAGTPEHVRFDHLMSWADHPDDGLRHFSGTATYLKTIEIPKEILLPGRRVYLDLGAVQVMAQVRLNGRDLGILWKPPFRVDITEAAHAGSNALEILVVNLLANRMIGDEQLPEDSDRKPNGTLRQWPDWLLAGGPSPTGRKTFSTWRLWKKDAPLLASGLLGPVRILCADEFRFGK
jgi:hypothetical protein